MELRLAVAHGTAQHPGDLAMLVAFNVIQHEHTATAGGEAFNGLFQNDSVDIAGKMAIFGPEVLP